MKRIAAAWFLTAATLLSAQGVAWRSWDAGVAEANVSGKLVMIDAVRTGCHYCEDMEAAVFEDEQTAAYIERHFVPVKVNLSESKMPLNLKVPMTPSFYFVTAGGEVVKTIPGSWNREDFRSFLEGIIRKRSDARH